MSLVSRCSHESFAMAIAASSGRLGVDASLEISSDEAGNILETTKKSNMFHAF